MINYIIQIILFQILFLAVYDLFLSKETFFTKNRLYLITTAILSFVLPLLRIPTLQKAVLQEYTILLPEVVLSPQKVIEQSSWYESINYVQLLFWVGVAVFSIVFVVKLATIIKLIFNNEIQQKKNYKLVLLPKNSKAFSFFNYIFLGCGIPQEKQAKIIQHELVHSKQKHSLDLLFFELLKIIMWFNPMIYLYQKRIALVHEFISDEVVVKQEEKSTYINNLLSEIFQVEHISFINQFYKHSLIKKRIIMMTKNKSKQTKQFKYLLLVPVLASMILYVSCANNEQETEKIEIIEVVENPTTSKKISKAKLVEEIIEVVETSSNKQASKKELIEEVTEIIENSNNLLKSSDNSSTKKVETIYEGGDVPFSVLDKAPTFPGCADGDKKCFNKSMRDFVAKEFNVKLADNLGLESGKKRVYVLFKIEKSGKISGVQARAPHPKLKTEAIRVVNMLPRFSPGEKNGEIVKVGYVLPITFNIQ